MLEFVGGVSAGSELPDRATRRGLFFSFCSCHFFSSLIVHAGVRYRYTYADVRVSIQAGACRAGRKVPWMSDEALSARRQKGKARKKR